MITEIMNINRLLWWLSWHYGIYLCLAILTNNEECHFSRSSLGQTYTCVMIMCIQTTCQI
ncbi:hypothetical protein NP493_1610g01016 [Ridgeia piscesae]|uniref:Uncharacterized protein n=1 Tax=Ridgeia piscesae TaxID=27915 RepID=A0AAD9N8L3_RIDPI|nr:hypothetical protein NP493_1610g01016 [Ridgeia piscesae]